MKKAKILLGKKVARVILFVLLDIFSLFATYLIATWAIRGTSRIDIQDIENVFKTLPYTGAIMITIYALLGLYSTKWEYLTSPEVVNIILGTISHALFSFAIRDLVGVRYPKWFFIVQVIVMSTIVSLTRLIIKGVYIGSEYKNTMIIGANEATRMVIDEINDHHAEYRSQIICIVDDHRSKKGQFINGIEIKGTTADIQRLAKRYRIKNVIITAESSSKAQFDRIINACNEAKCKIEPLPSIKYTKEEYEEIKATQQTAEENTNIQSRKDPSYYLTLAKTRYFTNAAWEINFVIYTIIKRILDVIFSLLGIILLSPIIIIISILIYREDGQPVIFKQLRTGYKGKKFYIFKFRSMKIENDVHDLSCKDQQTKIGKFIRKTSIDELPQLFNILRGDMSFIGPRPWIPEYYNLMTSAERKRTYVRPGMTGLAQCSGRNDLTIIKKIGYDLMYVKRYSIWMDLVVIVRTVKIVIKKTAADAGKDTIHNELNTLRQSRLGE